MSTLERLQRWYEDHCDGDWEHAYGVTVGTLDNPGWFVTVDVTGTPLASAAFSPIQDLDHERDWLACKVEGGKFHGHGGPAQLERILDVFLSWAAQNGWQAPIAGDAHQR
jgi:hypothetical protein